MAAARRFAVHRRIAREAVQSHNRQQLRELFVIDLHRLVRIQYAQVNWIFVVLKLADGSAFECARRAK